MRDVTDALAWAVDRLMALDGVRADLDHARGQIDALLWRRDVRAAAADYTRGSQQRGSRDSAAIDGADVAVVEDSPMGRVLRSAQAVTAEVPAHVETWGRAPLQVFARLHAVAARGHVADEQLGRPRTAEEVPDDPLRLAMQAPSASSAAGRMALLADVIAQAQQAPALAVAGIVHAEIVSARPFAWGSGIIGRAGVRLVLAARGVDPSLFSVPETGMLQLGRPGYVKAMRAYASGDMAAYFGWFAAAIGLGAQAAAP